MAKSNLEQDILKVLVVLLEKYMQLAEKSVA